LRERDITKRLAICELLFRKQKQKSFLHRIVTGNKKWIRYDNPKRKNHHINAKAGYSWKEGHAVHLIESSRYNVL